MEENVGKALEVYEDQLRLKELDDDQIGMLTFDEVWIAAKLTPSKRLVRCSTLRASSGGAMSNSQEIMSICQIR